MDDKRLRVGIISSVHGIHGECKVFPTTDEPDRFKELDTVYVLNHRDIDKKLNIKSVKFFKNMVILKFEGIDTPEEIQLLRNMDLYIDRKDAIPLKEGEYYIADLIDLKVIDGNTNYIGTVKEIFPTGANQVIEVLRNDGSSVLFPYISDCVLEVNIEEGYIKLSCDFMC